MGKKICTKGQNLLLKTGINIKPLAYTKLGIIQKKKNVYIKFSQVWGSFKKWPDLNLTATSLLKFNKAISSDTYIPTPSHTQAHNNKLDSDNTWLKAQVR